MTQRRVSFACVSLLFVGIGALTALRTCGENRDKGREKDDSALGLSSPLEPPPPATPPETVQVLGVVTDSNGEPVEGAIVWIFPAHYRYALNRFFASRGVHGKTDRTGAYSVPVPKGVHNVRALKRASQTLVPQEISPVRMGARAPLVQNFVLEIGRMVEGKVVASDTHEPIPAAGVRLFRGDLTKEDFAAGRHRGRQIVELEANGSGKFLLGPVRPDQSYSIRAAMAGQFEAKIVVGVVPGDEVSIELEPNSGPVQ